MDNSLGRLTEALNSPQPLKIDDRQHLFTGGSTIGTSDSLAHSSGSAFSHTIHNAIDYWTGKQAIDYSPIITSVAKSNSDTAAGISIVKPQLANPQIAHIPLALIVSTLSTPAKKLPNIAPQSLVITGIKSSYEVNSKLSIDSGLISDSNGWKDISKVDFWLTDAQAKRVELADANVFTTKDTNSAKFTYSTSLTGITAGNYQLNAVAFDKAGATSNKFIQSLVIKPINITPKSLEITGGEVEL
jgi:hypothetical protein